MTLTPTPPATPGPPPAPAITPRLTALYALTAWLLAIIGFIAHAFHALPSQVLPLAVLLSGAGVLLLVQWLVPAPRVALTRGLLLASIVVITLLVAYGSASRIWPAEFPLQKIAASPKPATTDPAPNTHGLRVTGPVAALSAITQISPCLQVRGTGKIPQGYEIWVANLNDQNGQPDEDVLFNLRRGIQQEGASTWHTDTFGVGDVSAKGKNYWIYVYLLPESDGFILENLISPLKDPNWRPSLRAPFIGVKPFDILPVQRSSNGSC